MFAKSAFYSLNAQRLLLSAMLVKALGAEVTVCTRADIDIQKINEGFERMEKGDVRYRFVIVMATLKNSAA